MGDLFGCRLSTQNLIAMWVTAKLLDDDVVVLGKPDDFADHRTNTTLVITLGISGSHMLF